MPRSARRPRVCSRRVRERECADAGERQRVDQDLQRTFHQFGQCSETRGEAARLPRMPRTEPCGADGGDHETGGPPKTGEQARIDGDETRIGGQPCPDPAAPLRLDGVEQQSKQ